MMSPSCVKVCVPPGQCPLIVCGQILAFPQPEIWSKLLNVLADSSHELTYEAEPN